MPHLLKALVRMPSVSLLPKDVIENTFHFAQPAATSPGDRAVYTAAVTAFYAALAAGASKKIGEYMANSVYSGLDACSVLLYEKATYDPTVDFGSPVATQNFTMPARASAGDFPDEVCVVNSYNGDLTDVPVSAPNPTPPPAIIRPQSRRRGRLFIGPLNLFAGDETTLAYVHPLTQFRLDIGFASKALQGTIQASTPGDWVVYSGADEDVHPVVGGYVDDAWDTQRRRGRKATLRSSWTV